MNLGLDYDTVTQDFDVARLVQAVNRVGAGGIKPHSEYVDRPLDWIVDKLGITRESLVWACQPEYEGHKWDGTEEPLQAILDALVDWSDVGVESGTGTGKSFLAACVVLWFLAVYENARVYTYAPKEDQLRLFMWSEIGKLWPRFQEEFPTAKLSDLRIRMDGKTDKWSAHGYAVKIRAGEESATGAQGAHAEHMLLITEETPGIDPSVMNAIANTKGADHNLQLALGNPDSQHDELHRFCLKPGVVHVRISALDHPNVVTGKSVVPGATGSRSVANRLEEYGEENRLYLSRVRGISPEEAADALIKGIWCREAAEKYGLEQFRFGQKALGVDVAGSEAGDNAAIARWQGACLLEVVSRPCPDPVALGVDVGAEIRAGVIDPFRVGVDAVGVGAGTVGRLTEMGYQVRALQGGPVTSTDEEARARAGKGVKRHETFKNLRAQMWWQLRLDLQAGIIALPDDAELFEDLTTPLWFTKGGKIIVEPKEEIRKRLGRSPDKGDAAVYGNWVRKRLEQPDDSGIIPITNYDSRYEQVVEMLSTGNKRKRAF